MTFGKTQMLALFKEKESVERIPQDQVMIVRLDGVGFSKIKKKFCWDEGDSLNDVFVDCMLSLTQKMCDEYRPTKAFVGSDEISLIFINNEKSEHPFGGKTQKLCSIMSAFCSVWANRIFAHALMIDEEQVLLFDCRAFSVKSDVSAEEYIDSRAFDVHRNCMFSQARKFMSHKELYGINSNELYGFVADHVTGVFEDKHMHYCGHTFARVGYTMSLREKLDEKSFDKLVAEGRIKEDDFITTYKYESEPVTTYYG